MIGLTINKPPSKLVSLARKRYHSWLYLADDFGAFLELKDKLPPKIALHNMNGAANAHYENVKEDLIAALSAMAKSVSDEAWWSGQIASRSTTATPIARAVAALLHAKDHIETNRENVLIICPDVSTLACIRAMCRKKNIPVRIEEGAMAIIWRRARQYLRMPYCLAGFMVDFVQIRFAARSLPLPAPNLVQTKKILIRSWFTEGTIGPNGDFTDRHFGDLHKEFAGLGYSVCFMPMFFNLGTSYRCYFKKMSRTGIPFLIPQRFATFRNVLTLIYLEFQRMQAKAPDVHVQGISVRSILNSAKRECAFDRDMMGLNLAYCALETFLKQDIFFEKILYPFENNAPEKLFILGKKKFQPQARLIGFQHSVWLSRQLGAELFASELDRHPLPDRIVASGPIYLSLLRALGFPSSKLELGPSLRFHHIRHYRIRQRSQKRKLFLFISLPFCPNASKELLYLLNGSIEDKTRYDVVVKPHPLLSQADLGEFVQKIGFTTLRMVEGTCQEWFEKADIALGIGTSVTQMEAVAAGVPLIRVVPANGLFLDPMKWIDYPIGTVSTMKDLRRALATAESMDDRTLLNWAKRIKEDYFSEDSQEMRSVFFS